MAKKKETKKKVKKKLGRPKKKVAKKKVVKKKTKAEKKIVSLFGDVLAVEEEELGILEEMQKIKHKLSAVDAFVFDKCIEGLNNSKSMTSWTSLMNQLLELASKVENLDEDIEIELNFDTIATDNAITATA